MFTGLIEEIGIINKIDSIPGGKSISISADKVLEDTKVNDSICVDGVCLTVTKISSSSFTVDAVGATLTKTTFINVRVNGQVNLERAVRLSDRLGGHLVQGHVNGIGQILNIVKLGNNYSLDIRIPNELQRYIISEGSIALNGISLTIAGINGSTVNISVIPHTWNNTSLKFAKIGDHLNIETDLIAKYVEKLMRIDDDADNKFSEEWFKNLGY